MERELTDLTERIDGVFGEDRRLDLERPGTYLRWRNEVRVDDRGAWSPRTSARASLQLPAFKRWVKSLQLVFSGESKGEDPTIRRLEDPGNPAFSPSIRAEQASLELRNDFFRTPATVVQAATGIRLRLPFEYFAALRFRQRLDLGWKVTSRFTQEGSWTSRERFGEKTQVDFDRPGRPTHAGALEQCRLLHRGEQGVRVGHRAGPRSRVRVGEDGGVPGLRPDRLTAAAGECRGATT